jgi:hypothetical protein
VLPWETKRASCVRSNSSTSIGSSSRPRYAGSDASSSGVGSAGRSARPGSDLGQTARPKRPSSANSTRGSSSSARVNVRGGARHSALDIASRCWQEFEGALHS